MTSRWPSYTQLRHSAVNVRNVTRRNIHSNEYLPQLMQHKTLESGPNNNWNESDLKQNWPSPQQNLLTWPAFKVPPTPKPKTKIIAYILAHLPNLSKYLLHQRWACICFMFKRPEGTGTSIFRIKVRAKWSSLLHGVWCTALPSFHAMYSLHSPVGWSHGNSETKYKIYIMLISSNFIYFFEAIYYPTFNAIFNKFTSLSLHKVTWRPLIFKPWKQEILLFGYARTMRMWEMNSATGEFSSNKSFWGTSLIHSNCMSNSDINGSKSRSFPHKKRTGTKMRST